MKKKKDDIQFAQMPIPKLQLGRRRRFPFEQLEVGGNCMIVKGMKARVLKSYAYIASKKLGTKYVMRTLDKERVGVWRVA